MPIRIEDVEKVAALARLEFTSREKKMLVNHLDKIMEYTEKLSKLDTEGVEPTKHVIEIADALREDIVEDGLSQEEAIKNAPKSNHGYFSVPKVIK